jgi:hypothetical protein
MSDRTERSVRRLIIHDMICSVAAAWTLTIAILVGISICEHMDWSVIATTGVCSLLALVGCTWIVATTPRQRGLHRSCERAAAGRPVQRIALAQVHAGVVAVSQPGWLVLAADSLTFTPDPELPSLLRWNVTLPEPGQEVDIPPIARAAIVRISSERVGYGRVLRVRWADPSGRGATADFFTEGRHGGWVAASPDRRARPARTWLRRRAGSLPYAIARFHRPAGADAAAPAGDQRRDALAKSK